MAITIDPATLVIFVPQADLTLISAGLYELDVGAFRLALKDWEDDPANMSMLDTHTHNTTLTLSGVTYARSVALTNGYTVEFEDGQYAVRCVGANHNLADVKVPNQVSLIIGNSAGLIQVAGSGGGETDWTASEKSQIRHRLGIDGAAAEPAAAPSLAVPGDAMELTAPAVAAVTTSVEAGKLGLITKILRNKTVTDPATGVMTVYDDDGLAVLLTAALKEDAAATQAYRGQGAERRERLA